MNTRRDAMKAIALATAASPALNAQHAHPPDALVQVGARKPKFFSPNELRVLAALADLIIPRTDTPGASDAGAHFLIDSSVSKDRALKQKWRRGLALIAKSPESSWVALLTAWSKEQNTPRAEFFRLLKDSVIDSYYSTREGLAVELGWHGNTFLPSFEGCTHPEHQG